MPDESGDVAPMTPQEVNDPKNQIEYPMPGMDGYQMSAQAANDLRHLRLCSNTTFSLTSDVIWLFSHNMIQHVKAEIH